MGYFSSNTVTENKIAPLDEQGKMYQDIFMQIMQNNLQEFGGYNVIPTSKISYDDPKKASGFQSQISDFDKQIQNLTSQLQNAGGGNASNIQSQIDKLNAQKQKVQTQLDGLGSSTSTDFKLSKQEDPAIQAAIAKYGADAPEVQVARETLKQQNLDNLTATANINQQFLKNLNKFASGDMSYTPEQAAQVDKYIAPVKDLILSTTNDLLTQFGKSDSAMRDSLGNLSAEIDKTGFKVEDAFQAASLQFDKSGANLMDVLHKVNNDNRAKSQFQFDLLSQQADQKAAQQSAMLGLPPGSAAEHAAAMKMKTDALTSIELELNSRESQGALSIQGGVETGKQQISLDRIQLQKDQGQKKEGVAQTGLALTDALNGKIESAIGNRGNALLNLEQNRQGMLKAAGYDNLPNILQTTSAGLAFDENLKNQKIGTQMSLVNPFIQQLGIHQQQQAQNATTTQTKNPSFFDSLTQGIGAAASVAGAVMGIPGIGGGGGGGGGGAMAPVAAPTPLNLNTYTPSVQKMPLGNFGGQLSAGQFS